MTLLFKIFYIGGLIGGWAFIAFIIAMLIALWHDKITM